MTDQSDTNFSLLFILVFRPVQSHCPGMSKYEVTSEPSIQLQVRHPHM
jgi:hypothetical protein